MLYMRNRSGVVFQRNEGLLSDDSLGFAVCDVHGSDLPVRDEAPKQAAPAPKQAAPAPKIVQTKKFSKKGK